MKLYIRLRPIIAFSQSKTAMKNPFYLIIYIQSLEKMKSVEQSLQSAVHKGKQQEDQHVSQQLRTLQKVTSIYTIYTICTHNTFFAKC